jgi:plasmid stabilization system protein ParE
MNLEIQTAADEDILRQLPSYSDQGLASVARRFYRVVPATFDAIIAMPLAGVLRAMRHPGLVGLRFWRVGGFEDVLVFYLTSQVRVIILRVLHGRRDVAGLLADET